jgi:hypothetical protein
MPQAKDRMDKSRVRETMKKGTSKSPLDTIRLKSWAINRMAKEKEKRIQPCASSPSFKKDFTFNEEKKQKRIPRKSRTSKKAGKRPEGEGDLISLERSAKDCWGKKTIAPKSKSPTLKKVLYFFFSIVF